MDRLTLWIGYISRLKEVRARAVGLVRSGSVRLIFDTIFNHPFSLVFKEA